MSWYRASLSPSSFDTLGCTTDPERDSNPHLDMLDCTTHPETNAMMISPKINDSDDGPPDSSEGWAVDERRTVATVTLNDVRHMNSYFKSKTMSKERLMETLNENYLSYFHGLDSSPTTPKENSDLFMIFLRPSDNSINSSKLILQNLDLSRHLSQKTYLHRNCPAIQRSWKTHFYFVRGLDRTIHFGLGPIGFRRFSSDAVYVIPDPILNDVDVSFKSDDPYYPIVANTSRVTLEDGVPFLSFLRAAFLCGSDALTMLGPSFSDVKSCFVDVVGVRVLMDKLMAYATQNTKRNCMQVHLGKTCNEGGAWKKSSRASRQTLGVMSVVDSFSPELR